jgi:hypothetical protein
MADINTDQNYPNAMLEITNKAHQPAPVDDVPVWASSDETVLMVTPAADGMSALIDTVAAGTARITVTADADLGDGMVTITGVSEDIHVTVGPSSMASIVTLNLGAPVDKPMPTPMPAP